MKLTDLLTQLKRIEPDANFARDSRGVILQLTPYPAPASWPVRAARFLLENVQIASTLAVTSLAILLFVNGPAIVSTFSPLKFTSVDRSAITAEAEAVDIQIQLTDLAYHEPTTPTPTVSAAAKASTLTAKKTGTALTTGSTQKTSLEAATSDIETSASDSNIDDILDVLAQ